MINYSISFHIHVQYTYVNKHLIRMIYTLINLQYISECIYYMYLSQHAHHTCMFMHIYSYGYVIEMIYDYFIQQMPPIIKYIQSIALLITLSPFYIKYINKSTYQSISFYILVIFIVYTLPVLTLVYSPRLPHPCQH